MDALRDRRKKLKADLKTVSSPRSQGSIRRKIAGVSFFLVYELFHSITAMISSSQVTYHIESYKAFRDSCQYQNNNKGGDDENLDDYNDYLDLSDLVRNN